MTVESYFMDKFLQLLHMVLGEAIFMLRARNLDSLVESLVIALEEEVQL